MEKKYSFMYVFLKVIGAVLMLMGFLLLLAPWYSLPLLILSFFTLFIAYEVYPPLGEKPLLDKEEFVLKNSI